MLPRRQFLWRLLTLGIALTVVVNVVVVAQPARAILGASVVTTVTDIPRTIFQAVDKVRAKIAEAFKVQGAVAFKSSLQIVARKLLDQASIALTTRGPGAKPLFITNPKTFFKNVADAAAGDYIDQFTRGVTGETGTGTSLSGDRGKFLIGRLLRAQTGQVVTGLTSQCKDQCSATVGVTVDPGNAFQGLNEQDAIQLRESLLGTAKNSHDTNIIYIRFALDPAGGTRAKAERGDATVECNYVKELGGTNGAVSWVIDQKATRAPGSIPPKDCVAHQEEAYNNERSLAQNETRQCVTNCGIKGTAVTDAAKGFSATDIFSAVQNADPRKAPAALANALSTDKSDLGQFLSAAGALTATVQNKVTGEQTNLQPNVLPVTTKVSDAVVTPSTATSELFGLTFKQDAGQTTYTGVSVADVLKGIASFLNSPAGTLMTRYFSQCGLNPDACKGPSNAKSAIGQLIFGSGNPTGVAGAQLLYATNGQADIISGDPGRNEISITDQLSTNGLIDSGFRQAIEGVLTVKEALQQKLLDAQKTFGFDKNGIEPRDGYPFRALQYLRKFRVIPVGWELAARYSQEFDHRDLSLGYLTEQYGICGQDGKKVCSRGAKAGQSCTVAADGTNDCGADDNGVSISCGASPYCGLVDPNWVLKAPQTYCRRQGAGEEILTKEFVCDVNNVDALTGKIIPAGVTCDSTSDVCTDTGAPNCVQSANNANPDSGRWVIERNSDTCADSQSCIAENEDGSCLAFGYCVQERQQFKFDGTQCSSQNSSCTSYTDPSGQQVAYLANTLDSANCTADNAGCTQFCRAPSYDPVAQTCSGNDTINFTAKVQQCSQGDVGCRQFLRTTDGANLLTNNSFEITDQQIDSNISASVAGWTKQGGMKVVPVTADDVAITSNNEAALKFEAPTAAGEALTQTVATGHDLFERTFTFSIRAKAAANCSAILQLGPSSASGLDPEIPRIPTDATKGNIDVTTNWDTHQVSITFPDQLSAMANLFNLNVGVQPLGCAGQGLTIDSAMLQEVGGSTAYRDYGVSNAVYLNSSRVSCSAADVGCLAYTPVAGGSVINGQVRNSNRCSAGAVGCATYQLEPITEVPQRSGGAVNIVAPKGQSCSAADVGCEEYTNLDEVAQGGEGKEFFKSVKQCLKPSQVVAPVQSATYYTWIGDANLGYVLRAYDLVKSNVDNAPCTNLTVGSTSTQPRCDDANRVITDVQCNAATLASNPDCAQYYDSTLATHYRLRSKTISITDDCHPYRNTLDQSDATRKDFVYYLSTKENVSCSSAAAGCRAYTGNSSGTTRILLSDTFETNGTANWVGGTASNASVSLNGHSMLINVASPSQAAVTNEKLLSNQLFAGRTYVLTFTAAASTATSSTITAEFGRQNGSTFDPISADTIFSGSATATQNPNITPPGPEWRSFTLGPMKLTQDLATAQLGLLVSGGSAYVDNVVLTEVNDHTYLIASSAPLCSAAEVGCAAYKTASGSTEYLTAFTRLCSEQVVGCEAMIDTQNSSTPFEQNVKGVVTPADTITTLVNNPSNYCSAAAKGCEAVGRPSYGPDSKIIGYQTQYLVNDPDRHSLDLCLNNELSCQAYTSSNGTAAYFKDPGERVCDYRANSVGGGAWYITGTSQLCPTVTPPLAGRPVGASCAAVCRGQCSNNTSLSCSSNADCGSGNSCIGGGDRLGQACFSDTECGSAVNGCVGNVADNGKISSPSGTIIGSCTSSSQCTGGNSCIYLAGSCAVEENSCTEYRDPSDPASCRSECPLSLSQGGSPDYVDGACRRTSCASGSRAGQNCQNDFDCQDSNGVHACVGGDGQPAQGLPGCRSYFYLKNSLQSNAGSCNGVVDPAVGCRPFNDTTNPGLNFRGQ